VQGVQQSTCTYRGATATFIIIIIIIIIIITIIIARYAFASQPVSQFSRHGTCLSFQDVWDCISGIRDRRDTGACISEIRVQALYYHKFTRSSFG
jgi:hypothetical protein